MKNGDALVDGIQLGRVFTMFEKDEVRSVLTAALHAIFEPLSARNQQAQRLQPAPQVVI